MLETKKQFYKPPEKKTESIHKGSKIKMKSDFSRLNWKKEND